MPIEIDGLDRLIARLEDIPQDMEAKMRESAQFVTKVAQTKAPKRTGNLIGSIEYEVDRQPNTITATVFTPVHYAPYQEFGTGLFAVNGDGRKTPWAYEDELTGETVFTRGNRPHPFLGPALRENVDVIMATLKEGLRDV